MTKRIRIERPGVDVIFLYCKYKPCVRRGVLERDRGSERICQRVCQRVCVRVCLSITHLYVCQAVFHAVDLLLEGDEAR